MASNCRVKEKTPLKILCSVVLSLVEPCFELFEEAYFLQPCPNRIEKDDYEGDEHAKNHHRNQNRNDNCDEEVIRLPKEN